MASNFKEQNDHLRAENNKAVLNEMLGKLVDSRMAGVAEGVARMRQELEAVRIDNKELRAEIAGMRELFDMLLPQARTLLVERLRQIDADRRGDAFELRCRKLFSGDGGVLYRVADLLAYCRSVTAEPSPRDILHYFSAFFIPVGNALLVFGARDAAPSDSYADLSVAELMKEIRAEESAERRLVLREGFERFYTGLWEASGSILERMADEKWQDSLEAMPAAEAQAIIAATVEQLAEALVSAGVLICNDPNDGPQEAFRPAADGVAARPLVMRKKDNYIYTYGTVQTNE